MLLVDSFQADFDFFFPHSTFWEQEISGNNVLKKQDSGSHEELKYEALWNMHPKQLSDCSRSEPDEYNTESRTRLVEGECLSDQKKKKVKKYTQVMCFFSLIAQESSPILSQY